MCCRRWWGMWCRVAGPASQQQRQTCHQDQPAPQVSTVLHRCCYTVEEPSKKLYAISSCSQSHDRIKNASSTALPVSPVLSLLLFDNRTQPARMRHSAQMLSPQLSCYGDNSCSSKAYMAWRQQLSYYSQNKHREPRSPHNLLVVA
jgi:hypothetical protein